MITLGEFNLGVSFFVCAWLFFVSLLLILKTLFKSNVHASKLGGCGMILTCIASLSGVLYNMLSVCASNMTYCICASAVATVAITIDLILFIRNCKTAFSAKYDDGSI